MLFDDNLFPQRKRQRSLKINIVVIYITFFLLSIEMMSQNEYLNDNILLLFNMERFNASFGDYLL